jgi:probable HAF family extracellular repeat protein
MQRHHNSALHALVFISSFGSSGTAYAANFTFTALNTAGEDVAYPSGVNAHDQVVGTAIGSFAQHSGFVWSAGKTTLINGTTYLESINDNGIAVGAAADDSTFYINYDTVNNVLTEVPIAFCKGKGRGNACFALGINNKGEVVGTSESSKYLGFIWANGTTKELRPPHEKQSFVTSINKAGDIIILNVAKTYENPFLYQKNKFTQLAFPGATETFPSFLTDSVDVGGYYYTGSASFGFVLSGGTYTTYSPVGSTFSTVSGIGPAGQIYGTFNDTSGNTHGFENVNGTYYQIDVPNSTYTSITGVGASGIILGSYHDSQGYYGYVATCPKKDICTQ